MNKEEIIKQCRVVDKVVFLPEIDLKRKDYMTIAKHLECLGGKWNRKEKGFVFATVPTELLPDVLPKHVDVLKKEFQFFPTPAPIADQVVARAVKNLKHDRHLRVLEPSAGRGSLLTALLKIDMPMNIEFCELHDDNRLYCAETFPTTKCVGDDFLQLSKLNFYDIIVANPPFSKNQDIVHIRKMYDHLNPGGRLVTVCSNHWVTANDKKSVEFREWLDTADLFWTNIYLPTGTFKESGTNIACQILSIQKD